MGRKKEPKLTQEELVDKQLRSELNDLRKLLYLIPEPTYYFEIGTQVLIGNLEDVTVVNVLENGKIYEIDYTFIQSNYGNPIKHIHQRRYVKWTDIRRLNNNAQSLIKNEDIRLSYSQRMMGDLLSKTYHFGVDFNPDYQRDYVWSLEDKIKLIDSIFNNVDIGKFTFIHLGYSSDYMYEILDGKQRMRAILDFYEDRFQYNGFYYSDLSWIDKHHFTEYSINVAETRDITEEQKLRYFINLNTGGRIMSEEHINKVISMLQNINPDKS